MDDTTNLNSGLGTSQQWSQQPGAPVPPGVQKAQGEVPGQITPANGEAAPAEIDENFWQDIMAKFDTSTPSLDANSPATPYVTYANQPILKKSTVNDPGIAYETIELIQQPTPEKIQRFLENFQANLPVSPEVFAQYADVKVDDPEINALAEKTGVPPGFILKNIQEERNYQFKQILNDLPPDVADKLNFARHVPEAAQNLSPELKEQLASINKQINDGVSNSFGFSDDWTGPPVDSTDFLSNLSAEADVSLDKLIEARVADGSLTEADARTLKAMHAGLATGTPTLRNLLTQLEGQVTAQMQAKFGFDVGYQPKGDLAFYNNVINGDFAQTYQKNVAKYTGTATAEQKVLLQKYAANPNDPSIPADQKASIATLFVQIQGEKQLLLKAFPDSSSLPDNLKSAAKSILEETTTTIIGKYGLDASWQPSLNALVAAGIDPATYKVATNGLGIANELLASAKAIGAGLPEGPEKNEYMNFLKLISEALSGLQESIYAMQASQSNASKTQNRAKLDMQLNEIDTRQKAADKVKEAAAKMANLGPLGKIFMWIFKVILLVISSFFGPLAMLVATTYFVDSAVKEATGNKDSMIEKFFKLVSKSLPPAAAAVINTLILSVISMGNPFMALQLFTSDANTIKDIVKACGGDEMAQALAQMIVNTVIMLALMIALMIVSGGAATTAAVAGIAAQMSLASGVAATTCANVVRISMVAFQTAIAAITIAMESAKMNNNIQLSIIDIVKGEQEAHSEEIQGMIAALKKLIAKLFELLQNNSDRIVSISEAQGKKWTDAGQISSEIFG